MESILNSFHVLVIGLVLIGLLLIQEPNPVGRRPAYLPHCAAKGSLPTGRLPSLYPVPVPYIPSTGEKAHEK
jgi:hypothetical protein